MNKLQKKKKAFTLIELLVVMAIISALVGILSVAQRKVKIVSTNLKQKGEFHGMEISIELFRNEFDRYPDSSRVNGGSDYTCGAQRLAEALEGRDERGFHPKSKWHPALEPTAPNDLYNDTTLKQRKPVYFELKHSDLYTPERLWGASATGSLQSDKCPLITDVFVRNKAADTTINGKVGSPVLYFKADSTKRFRVDSSRGLVTNPALADYQNWIYNFEDNIDILEQPWLRDPALDTDTPVATSPHYLEEPADDAATTDAELFYRIITQREDAAANYYKPYNQDTFILISAGWDGIYGTKDDLTNFNY